MAKIIDTDRLSFSYTEDDGRLSLIPAISEVTLSIEQGEYVAVLGHNGSGKSTFAKMLNLVLLSNSGKLMIDGEEVKPQSELTEEDVFNIRKKVGMVFQNPDNQIVATIVEEDVAFGPENLGVEPTELRLRVDEALKNVGMSEYADHSTYRLSGGQKQRVAIAGVIAMKPKCIIFDESTAMLDPLGRKDVLRVMERLNREENITIIHITHYMEEAARADRVVVINDGRLFMDSSPREVFSRIDEIASVGLEAPQVTELLHKLRKMGYDLPNDCIDADECVEILSDFLNAERKTDV